MSIRVSTNQIYDSGVAAINGQQAALLQVQQQLSAGRRLINAADDPAGAAQEVTLTANLQGTNQMLSNQSAAQSELTSTETYLASAGNALSSALTSVIQGGNPALSDSDRQSILSTLQGLRSQLLGLANTQDSNGNYIFAGYKRDSQPFVQTGSGGVAYQGDAGVRQVQIGPNQNVDVSFSGNYLFNDVPTGKNGLVVSADGANTGTAVLNSGSIQDNAAWSAAAAGGPYTVEFGDDGAYTVSDASGAEVGAGTLDGDQALQFDGVQIGFTGTPASGDKMQFGAGTSQSMFDTLDQAIAALSTPSTDANAATARANALYVVNANLQGAMDRLSEARSSIGARQNQISAATTSGQAQADQLTAQIAQVVGSDPDSLTGLASELAKRTYTVQAAQQSYASIAQLSIFNYL